MPLILMAHGVGMGATESEAPAPGDPSDGLLPLLGVGRCLAPFVFAIEMAVYAIRMWL